MAYDFSGKRALVTGASRGIGKEVAKQLVKYGATVFALARNQDNLNALKSEIPSIETVCVDVADWKKTRKMVEEIGDIDLLVNNAAIGPTATLSQTTEELLDSTFAVNLKAAVNISQVVSERLKKNGKPGKIVNISSCVAIKTVTDLVPYSLSKVALDKLTKLMAIELAPYQIRVNSVNPTVTLTDMITVRQNETGKSTDDLKKFIPLGDVCTVEDIADSVLFLLSDKSRMITGTTLAVDGGGCST